MTELAVAVPVATVWTTPDAPRDRDAAAVADRPDLAAWTESLDAAGRLDLHGRTLTQALLGEPVVPSEERDGWVRIVLPWQSSDRHPDGYPGWVRSVHVGQSAHRSDRTVAVTTPTALCRTRDATEALSYGTVLPVLDEGPYETTVALPGSRTGRLPADRVRAPGADLVAAGWVESLLDSARQFLGLRYLWGGTCGWGLDCSGFVHLVHRVHGRRVPRDALEQLPAARPVPLDAANPGDLYFFARPGELPFHVGYVTRPAAAGERTMLHAPEGTELIEETTLAPDRLKTLVGVGSFAPDVAGS
jgi:gamma-D-glutamyl-L-lysine dipeptidyl-peptidase